MYGDLAESKGLAERLSDGKPDIGIFLGDSNTDDIDCVKDWLKKKDWLIPLYGVFGNHDMPSLLDNCNIESLHLKTVTVGEMRIGGFGGSINYKNSSSGVLFTNKESDAILADFTDCNIFITHSNPQFPEYEIIDVTPEPRNFCEKIKRKFFRPALITEQRVKPARTDCHAGLTGIANYIEAKKPAVCLHGHIHERKQYMHGTTLIRSCYGVEIITI